MRKPTDVRRTGTIAYDGTRRSFLAGGAAVLGIGIARAARADRGYPHLADRTVTLMVGAEVGGGFDLCGRTLARHMEGLVPGLRIEVKNVTQASGMLGAKILQTGPTDGSMLLTCSPALISGQLLDTEGVAFDLRQWSWIGKLLSETYLLIKGPGADFANLKELQAKQTSSSMSVRSTSGAIYYQALWTNAVLGTRIKPVPGYKSVEREMALVQGEVMLTIDTYPTGRRMLETPSVDVVLRMDGGEVPERFRSRPLFADLIADRPAYKPIVAVNEANARLSRWFAAPPGTDPAILAEWRALFEETVALAAFDSDMTKLDFQLDPMTGIEVAELIDVALADTERTRALLKSTLDCGKALADGENAACGQT
jgi:tripartite-type tricarboxylate transporter receptor subunit TctC